MLADVIVLAIVGVLFVLCIRKQIQDYKNGIPSCGLSSGCGGCSGCSGCSASCSHREDTKISGKFKSKNKQEAV